MSNYPEIDKMQVDPKVQKAFDELFAKITPEEIERICKLVPDLKYGEIFSEETKKHIDSLPQCDVIIGNFEWKYKGE